MTETIALSTRPTIPIYDAHALVEASERVLAEARRRVAEIERLPLEKVTPESVLDAWDRMSMMIEDVHGPISLLNSVHPDAEVRDAGDRTLIEESVFMTELFQNEQLYERVRRVVTHTNAQKQLKKDLLEAFEDSGVALPAEKRDRFKAISERLIELAQEFSKNIRENKTALTFSKEECQGLPQSYLDRVPHDERGNIVVGFDYPDFVPFMANAASEQARKRYYVANMNRGTARNLAVLDEIVALRKEIGDLYGVPSYAHYVTKRRMVENPETVMRFLNEVKSRVTEAELGDLRQLAEMKAELTGLPIGQATIERWDVVYYRERLREKRYAVDQETLREYFPTLPTVHWMLDITERLYGIRFTEAIVPVWHDDVMYYDVEDALSGERIGGIYLDLYPRADKYKHAAAWPVRGVSRNEGRQPISVLVANFNRRGLTHSELETLLHEFGHVMHGVLSRTEYNQHSGTSVERDFVEAPSQMYEEWASRMESLKLMRNHCATCPLIDDSLVQRIRAAKKFGSGIDYGRQLLYASFDMALSGEGVGSRGSGVGAGKSVIGYRLSVIGATTDGRSPTTDNRQPTTASSAPATDNRQPTTDLPAPAPDSLSLRLWTDMERSTPMGYVEGSEFPGTFEHIASGYAAGYYGYMWAKVIALDLISAFGSNIMNEAIGRRFREMILSRGSEEPARELVERFLGRPVSSDAFFAEIRGE
ncbi:MAG TPA: M3 family metallopeptidase [Thermoanaerobaculia bacterium]|jgi:thimet oligopeptidase|nr:M3 family metallopeptidase [Thermoanaerobaculia bacterium]